MEKEQWKRPYSRLDELAQEWQLDEREIQYYLVLGKLKGHVWIPLIGAFKLVQGHWGELSHFENFTKLSRHQCHRLFRQGHIGLRRFSKSSESQQFLLPETADDIVVTKDELVVLSEEKSRFEGAALRPAPSMAPSCHHETFQNIDWRGEVHQFGPMQSKCLRLLHESSQTDIPWTNGKRLLQAAGSQCFNLSNLFKRKPIWREIVDSDGRGNYRMSEKFLVRED